MSTTARLCYLTLALQAACLVAVVIVYLVEHLATGATTTVTAGQALQTIGSIAVAVGVGGGAGTVGYGMRHYGTAAPTSAMQSTEP